jgi:hypothetical protein
MQVLDLASGQRAGRKAPDMGEFMILQWSLAGQLMLPSSVVQSPTVSFAPSQQQLVFDHESLLPVVLLTDLILLPFSIQLAHGRSQDSGRRGRLEPLYLGLLDTKTGHQHTLGRLTIGFGDGYLTREAFCLKCNAFPPLTQPIPVLFDPVGDALQVVLRDMRDDLCRGSGQHPWIGPIHRNVFDVFLGKIQVLKQQEPEHDPSLRW